MKAIIIDDEPWMLEYFCKECGAIDEIELVGSYRNPYKALDFAGNNAVDLAFIDVEMPQMDGFETAKKLRETIIDVKIIMVSAYDEIYIRAKPECIAYGYLRKPYRSNDLRAVINKIK